MADKNLVSSVLVTIVVSAVVSAATAWVVISLHDDGGDVVVSPAGGAQESGAEETASETPAAEDPASKSAVSKLNADVEALTDKVSRLSEKVESQGPGAGPKGPELAEIFSSLTKITQSGREMVLKKKMGELLDHGEAIVPLIEEFLATNVDYDYGGYSSGGSYFKSHPSLRSVMIDLLSQVGSERAREIVLAIFERPAHKYDLDSIMVLFSRTSDETMRRGFADRLPKLIDHLGKNTIEGFRYSMLGHFLPEFVSRLDLGDGKAFTASVTRCLAATDIDNDRFTAFFPMLINRAPEAAVRLLSEKRAASPESEIQFFRLIGFGRQANPERTFTFAKLCLRDLSLKEKDRQTVYMALSSTLRRSSRRGPEKEAIGAMRQDILNFVAERREVEKNPAILRLLKDIEENAGKE
ncbi:MAG: hypothetical protein ACYS47_10710 [Planctomycetota bacterium]|jgi:hypothetical protein